jgi:hypothetical protein
MKCVSLRLRFVVLTLCMMMTLHAKESVVPSSLVDEAVAAIVTQHGESVSGRARQGVTQVASFWRESDGKPDDYLKFCVENFVGEDAARDRLFAKLSDYFEVLDGHFNAIALGLNRVLHLDLGPVESVDLMFGGLAAGSHLSEDLFRKKIAFLTILNFPWISLSEKDALSRNWSRRDWAHARLGDRFTSRVQPALYQEYARISTEASRYIDEYNIHMASLRDAQGNQLFPEGMKLISHWGLRDEIKANYAVENGLGKQRMIHAVMERIILQEIPQQVINRGDFSWDPVSNRLWDGVEEVTWEREPDTRYERLFAAFRASHVMDPYFPRYPHPILRAFDEGLEMSAEQVEALFTEMLASPQFRSVGALVSQRLGRNLEPFDIWYDGFKPRSVLGAESLNAKVQSRYPNREAFQSDLAPILVTLGYTPERAEELASKISVDASRGAGHAWGAAMKGQQSRLRTRIGPEGLNYKGFNIAIHELGHNVEQTISLYDVDYHVLNGVPNTAFTEALAFIFQVRDLDILGIDNPDPLAKHWRVLDNFWGTCEIMGVSLVDLRVWRWMDENRDASAADLREATVAISKDVWNSYFAPVFGHNDQAILGIYSHMIAYPLYLAAYPLGHLIEFQIEQQIDGRDFGTEVDRIFRAGRLTPKHGCRRPLADRFPSIPCWMLFQKRCIRQTDLSVRASSIVELADAL